LNERKRPPETPALARLLPVEAAPVEPAALALAQDHDEGKTLGRRQAEGDIERDMLMDEPQPPAQLVVPN
jgi:hypothetical protein